MISLESKRPRRIRRGQVPTGNPQSENFGWPPLRSDQPTTDTIVVSSMNFNPLEYSRALTPNSLALVEKARLGNKRSEKSSSSPVPMAGGDHPIRYWHSLFESHF